MKKTQNFMILVALVCFVVNSSAQISFNSQEGFTSYYNNIQDDTIRFTYLPDTVLVNVPPLTLSNFNPNWELPTSSQRKARKLGYQNYVNEESDVGVDCHNDMVKYFQRETKIEKKKKTYKFLF